jgi:hypothetical protein
VSARLVPTKVTGNDGTPRSSFSENEHLHPGPYRDEKNEIGFSFLLHVHSCQLVDGTRLHLMIYAYESINFTENDD